MGARINFPFHGDREHLSPHDGEKIAAGEKHVTARAKRSVGIMRSGSGTTGGAGRCPVGESYSLGLGSVRRGMFERVARNTHVKL